MVASAPPQGESSVRCVGALPIVPNQAPLPPWADDIDGSRKVVLVTQGTLSNHDFTELVAPNTVNTMPEKTMDAVADHGVVTGDTVTGTSASAQKVFDELEAIGIDLTDVFLVLENEGVEKFEKSWQELIDATQGQLDQKA